jgi:hypothetical protein
VGTAKRCAALKTAIDAHAAKLTAMRNGNTAAAIKHEQDYARAVASVSSDPPTTLPSRLVTQTASFLSPMSNDGLSVRTGCDMVGWNHRCPTPLRLRD